MRKYTGYLLSVVFIYSVLGYVPVSQLVLGMIQSEVASRLASGEDEGVQWMYFSAEEYAQLEWEHDREFRYQGAMYDVVRKEKVENGTRILCHHDKKETRLRNHMRRQQAQNTGEQGQGVAKWLKHFSPYVLPQRAGIAHSGRFVCELNFRYKLHLAQTDLDVPSPPPWNVFYKMA